MSASDHLSGEQFKSLGDVKKAGYVTDEWNRWQQGGCGTYALALTQEHPHLQLGAHFDSEGVETHFFAHDGKHAYDSAGKHQMPYRGVTSRAHSIGMNEHPDDYGLADQSTPEDLAAAKAHAKRNRIVR